jgi:NAD-dependent SIR2 family protein deacetylase
VDARQDCLDVLKQRFPDVQTVLCDLNAPAPLHALGAFDVIHCYGILYHLEDPAPLVAYMGEACSRFAIVETCVSPGKSSRVEIVSETHEDYTQSSSGRACRPSRTWVFEELGRAFPYVYLTRTQPAHPEFPIDWNALENAPPLIRSVFVASKEPLDLPALSPVLLDVQERFDQPAYIERLEATAAQRQRELEAKEAALTELHREATRRGEALDQTTAAIEQQQQRLTMLEAAAAERLTELHAKEAALADLLAEAERRREALELTTTANQQLHQRVATQQHQLHTLQTTAAERLAQLQAKEAALIELHGEMERATSTIGEQQRHLETLRSAAAERLAELQAKEAVLRELHGEAERRREALERAAATVREQQQRLEALEATTAEQQRELDELRKTAAYLEEQRQTLEAERNQLRRENYALTLTVRRFEQETFTAFLQRRWTQRK